MISRKVICNATNSASIDHEGNVWVWGAARHRLLGEEQDNNQLYPRQLTLEIGNKTEEEKRMRDAFMKDDEMIRIHVKEIAMGANHMLALGNDALGGGEEQMIFLDYAESILVQVKEYLIEHGALLLGINDDVSKYTDRELLEKKLKDRFKQDKNSWPYARWSTFVDLIFKDVKIFFQYDTQEILTRLQNDLSDGSYSRINLRKLRDQLMKQDESTNVIFGWGLNDERLGQDPSKLNDKDESSRYLSATMLHQFNRLKVQRIACGDSFSLTLTESGRIYSWGIGQNGCLGLGDTTLSTFKPKRVHFNPSRQTVVDDEDRDDGRNIKFRAIAVGQSHCLALSEQGAVYSWGAGLNGRLGHGDLIGSAFPEKIQALSHLVIIDIACGDAHSAVITEDGMVYTWGSSDNAKLGISEQIYVDREIPQLVDFFASIPVKEVVLGLNNSFAISRTNEVYAWGSANFGKIGIPKSESLYELPMKLWLRGTLNVYQIAPGPFHTLFLSREGEMAVCGSSNEGKLGIFRLEERMVGKGFTGDSQGHFTIDWPWTLEEEIPARFYLSREDHDVFETFHNFNKQYWGQGMLRNDNAGTIITQIACSQYNSYVLLGDGRVYAMGINDSWQCTELESMKNEENETVNDQYLEVTPEMSKWLDNIDQIKLDFNPSSSYSRHPMFVPPEEDGEITYLPIIPVQCRDLINKIQKQRPVKRASYIEMIDKRKISSILIRHVSAGMNHALATSTGYQVFGWGDNDYGQLGLDRPPQSNIPISQAQVVEALQNREIIMTACGKAHSLFLTREGRMYACGFNEYGELGIPIDDQAQNSKGAAAIILKCKVIPVQIDMEVKIRFIAAGQNHSLAISSGRDGINIISNLYSWGLSTSGQLGHHKIKNSYNLSRPKKVKFLDAEGVKPVFVSAGPKHTLAIDSENSLWYFGEKASVGIADKKEKYMFAPKQLRPDGDREGFFENKFTFAAAGPTMNLAVTKKNGHVYQFGLAMLERSKKGSDESLSEEEEDEDGSDNSGDRALEANMSFGKEKFDETVFERINFHHERKKDWHGDEFTNKQIQRDQHMITQVGDGDKAQMCAVGNNHFMVIQRAIVRMNCVDKEYCRKDYFAFSWGTSNQFGQLGLNDDDSELAAEKRISDEMGRVHDDFAPATMRDYWNNNFKRPQTLPVIDRIIRRKNPKEYIKEKVEGGEASDDDDDDDDEEKLYEEAKKQTGVQADAANAKAGKEESDEEYDAGAVDKLIEKKMYKWPVQWEIHQSKDEIIKTQDLLKKDDMIVNQFNLLTQDFHSRISGRFQAVSSMKQIVQDALVYRINNFPTSIEKNALQRVSIPKTLIRSKQIFEGIFTYLQAHPCYLNTWITKICSSPRDVAKLFETIFGKKEIRDNPRVINTLSVMARYHFDREFARYQNVQVFTQLGLEESVFRVIFRLILDSQTQNINFNKNLIASVIFKMRNYALHDIKDSKKIYKLKPKLLMLIMQETMQEMLRNLQEMDSTDVFHKLTNRESNTISLQILSLLNYVYSKLIEKTKEKFNISDEGDDGADSDEGEAANADKKDDDKQEDEAIDDLEEQKETWKGIRNKIIYPYLLSLIFESAWDEMNEINYEKIKFLYWNYDLKPKDTELDTDDLDEEAEEALGDQKNPIEAKEPEPQYQIFDDFNEKQYFIQISNLFARYFKRQHMGLLEEDKENYEQFLKDGFNEDVSRDTTNYVLAISKALFIENKYKPLNFDYLLVKQLFVTSMMPEDPVVSIKLSDLVEIYNILVDKKELRWIETDDPEFREPLGLLRRNLGDKKIELGSSHDRQMNLRIKVRFLATNAKLVRCRTCTSPVIETMVPYFNRRYNGEKWKCKKPGCGVVNPADRSRCNSCSKNIAEGLSGKMKDSIFERYQRLRKEDLLQLKDIEPAEANNVDGIKIQTNMFIKLLRELPRLDKGQTFYKQLSDQVNLLDEKYGRTFDPLLKKAFERFKKEIEDYKTKKVILIEANLKKKGNPNEDDKLREAERLLAKLLRRVASRQLREKVTHRDMQIEYGQALNSIQLLHGQIFNESMSLCENLDNLFNNANTGLSSPFLRKIVSEIGNFINLPDNMRNDPSLAADNRLIIWAGSLDKRSKKQIKQANRGGEDVRIQKAEHRYMQRMQAFFRDVNAASALSIERVTVNFYDMESAVIKKKAKDFKMEILTAAIEYVGIATSDDMTTVGSVSFVDMLNSRVLKKADLTNYDYDEAVLMDSMFQLSRDSDGGFYVEMVFKEVVNPANQVALHRFYLAREDLLEMRINFFNSAVFINGNLQFRVYELVKLLNVVIAQNNVFSRLNPERIEQRRLEREKLKKERGQTQMAESEALKSNDAVLL